MQLHKLITRRSSELLLTGVRAGLALVLALAIGLTSSLHQEGLIGTLGMYAVTDGVLAALSRSHAAGRYVAFEAALSILLGIVIMAGAHGERTLLVLFCARNVLVGMAELLGARHVDGGNFLAPKRAHAYLAYAGLSAAALSVAFLLAAAFGYGALDLHSCIAGQLGIWAVLVFMHLSRMRVWTFTEPERAHPTGRQRASWS